MRNIKKLKVVGYAAMILSFAFIIKTFMGMDIDFKYLKSPTKILVILILAVVMMLNFYLSAYSWKLIVEFFDNREEKIPFLPVMDVYAKSNVAKYLPGNVMQFAGRNVLGSNLGISQFAMLAGTLIEILLLLITGTLMALIFFTKTFENVIEFICSKALYKNILIIMIIVGIVLLTVLIFFISKKKVYRDIIKKMFSINFLKVLIKLLIFYFLGFIVMGVVFYLSFTMIMGVEVDFFLVMSSAIISWVVGYIIPGAPGGIGIREAILLMLLGGIIGKEIVAMGAIISRLISIISDLLSLFFDYFIIYVLKKNNNEKE